ncbi:hypothetical protein BC833DRAFT_574561 [Globomyces pollinis-pini]|nr:hypothetical protein BC833DRAFT_574561 [Globomyces pollinis-pini]KAJ3000466.1 hypothetical protein HDV02_005331 [Globomyces sp. JEL0801]
MDLKQLLNFGNTPMGSLPITNDHVKTTWNPPSPTLFQTKIQSVAVPVFKRQIINERGRSAKHCCWKKPVVCQMVFETDEELYEHTLQAHIGRKKTDNLCLSCHWDNCHVVCTKRDHITSHLKVHIPVKPFKCNKCPRTFKRGQDLTKHLKSHDELNEKKSSSNISVASSDGTYSPTIADGYLSDPCISDSITITNEKHFWNAKSVSKKRKQKILSHISQKSRLLEQSIHLKNKSMFQ